MKNLFISSILVTIWTFSLNAQTTLRNATTGHIRTFQYELLVEAPIFECNILGHQLDSTVQVAPKGAIFSKIAVGSDNIIIRFWLWKGDADKRNKLNYADSTKTTWKYFLLSTDEFNLKAIPRQTKKSSFVLGATSTPFRMRHSPFDFSPSLSFGTSFGVKVPLSNYQPISINFVGGLHITHVTIDSFDTQGAVRDIGGDSEPAISPVLGVVLEFHKVQVGFYLGWDFISSEDKNNWIYQGKTWFSLGIGTSIFNSSSTANLGGTGKEGQ